MGTKARLSSGPSEAAAATAKVTVMTETAPRHFRGVQLFLKRLTRASA